MNEEPLINSRPYNRQRLAGEAWLWTAVAIPFVTLAIIAVIALVQR